METIQKVGAFALILTAKCLRGALCTLADMREASDRRAINEAQIRALREEVESLHTSLEEIKASLDTTDTPWDNLLVQ